MWRARGDLNPGPPAPKAGALSWLGYGPAHPESSYIFSRGFMPSILSAFAVTVFTACTRASL